MTAWKDISNYSQNHKRRTPNAFELRTPHLTLIVSRHIHYPGKWTYRLRGDEYPKPIDAETAAEAKALAVQVIIDQLEESLDYLRKVKS